MSVLHLTEIEVAFRHPLHTIAGVIRSRRSVIVGWESGDHTGWGEAPAFPSGRFGTSAQAWDSLAEPTQWDGDRPGVPIAAAALQAARADATARAAGQTLHERLGGSGARVRARHPIGLVRTSAELERIAGWLDLHELAAVKLKITPGADIEVVAGVRDRMPDLDIGVDANGSYSSPDDPIFEGLAALDVSFVEQPFPAHDVDGHRSLTQRGIVPICLDESVDRDEDLAELLATGGCDLISIKLNRFGLERFIEVRETAVRQGVGVRIGGTFDTSIGRRHLLAVATLPGVVDAEVGPPSAYLADDIADYPTVDQGWVAPGAEPGIGTNPDSGALDRVTLRRVMIDV